MPEQRMPHLIEPSLEALKSAHPGAPAHLRHQLQAHPLLTIEALARAATQLPSHLVERREAHTDLGHGFPLEPKGNLTADDLVRDITGCDSWVMLRFVERLPEYKALLTSLITEIAPATMRRTGQALGVRGFIFISAPGTLTPFHFDAEYNILFQIAGQKEFATFPPLAPFISQGTREAYHESGDNLLDWEDGFGSSAMVHKLAPGDALYVPYEAPHWVRVGSQPSISLSLTWQSKWSQCNRDALLLNRALRCKGLTTLAQPPAWPKTAHLRSLFYRAACKASLL